MTTRGIIVLLFGSWLLVPSSSVGAEEQTTKNSVGFRIRGTLPWHNFLSGPSAWDEEDYEQYLDRLQVLGMNYVAFHCYTGGAERYAPYVEPLVRVRYRDVLPLATFDTSLTARWGYRPMAVDQFVFGTDKLFRLPPGTNAFGSRSALLATNNRDHYDRAQALMRRVIQMAHDRGVQVGVGFEFGIHPPELASIVPPRSWIRGAMLPDPTHPASIEILHNTLDDVLQAYPQLDVRTTRGTIQPRPSRVESPRHQSHRDGPNSAQGKVRSPQAIERRPGYTRPITIGRVHNPATTRRARRGRKEPHPPFESRRPPPYGFRRTRKINAAHLRSRHNAA